MEFESLPSPSSPFYLDHEGGLDSPIITKRSLEFPPPPPTYDVQVESSSKPYWEQRHQSDTRPSWTYLSLAVQQDPLDIISRSRRGEYVVRMSWV